MFLKSKNLHHPKWGLILKLRRYQANFRVILFKDGCYWSNHMWTAFFLDYWSRLFIMLMLCREMSRSRKYLKEDRLKGITNLILSYLLNCILWLLINFGCLHFAIGDLREFGYLHFAIGDLREFGYLHFT